MTQLAHLTLFAQTVPTVSSVPCKFFFMLQANQIRRSLKSLVVLSYS